MGIDVYSMFANSTTVCLCQSIDTLDYASIYSQSDVGCVVK